MRIAAITTVSHNIGDDLVREGILYLLGKIGINVEVFKIHKHLPITVRPEWEWMESSRAIKRIKETPGLSLLKISNWLDSRLPLNDQTDKILSSDVLIQCGAPVYWLNGASSCDRSEWYDALIRRRWDLVRERVPFLNLAGGSCQAYHSNGEEFLGAVNTLAFVRRFFDDCDLTILRDKLAAKILQSAGRDAKILPCTSIFARHRVNITPKLGSYVALNYMPAGGHYSLGAKKGAKAWENTFGNFVRQLPAGNDYIFVCHNRLELREARRLFPKYKTFWSDDYLDYLRFFSAAKFGIFNRVHAAFALASFGRPSFVTGTDSRARMCDMIGLESGYVDEVSSQKLLEEAERLEASWKEYNCAIEAIKVGAEVDYLRSIRTALMRISNK